MPPLSRVGINDRMTVWRNGTVTADADAGNVCRGSIKWILAVGDINTAVNLNVVIITCYAQANNVQVLSAGGGQIVVINIQRPITVNGIAVPAAENSG